MTYEPARTLVVMHFENSGADAEVQFLSTEPCSYHRYTDLLLMAQGDYDEDVRALGEWNRYHPEQPMVLHQVRACTFPERAM